jgi:hypothetical protein
LCPSSARSADDLLLADGEAWPGRLLLHRGDSLQTLLVRPDAPAEDAVPRVQSVTTLADGRIVFCSGLDRHLFVLGADGERLWHHGGYLARCVRTDTDGTLYWSGLETPRDGAPLPDGFIYAWDAAAEAPRTVLTFSQGDVGHEWWGAFDVRDGRVYVGTLSGQTRIYDVTEVPLRHVATLPLAARAFRFAADGSLCACDGQGRLYRFADWQRAAAGDLVLESSTPFVDFAFPAARP